MPTIPKSLKVRCSDYGCQMLHTCNIISENEWISYTE